MSFGSKTKTLLVGALALGGAALASAAPAGASDINVRIDVGQAAGFHQAQFYGDDDYGYGRRFERRGYDRPYGFGGGHGFRGHGYGHGGFGGCRIVIRERFNRFGELVQIRRRICG